jgi:hypothetical protein
MTLSINGANSGRPYPPPGGAKDLPPPNPPRALPAAPAPVIVTAAPQKVGAGGTAICIALTDISLRKRTEAALRQQVDELERFNRAAVDRELAMIELKRQVNALSSELGRAPPFALDFAETG